MDRGPRRPGGSGDRPADRDALRAHRHLTAATAAWLERDGDPNELYRGARLETAEQLLGSGAVSLNHNEENLRAAVIDTTNGFAYFVAGNELGIIVKIRLSDAKELDGLMDEAAYREFVAEQE